MSTTTNTLNWHEALQQIENWNNLRHSPSIKNVFFSGTGDSFLINTDFDYTQFESEAHAYFGITIDPDSGEVQEFNLLFIPKEHDNLDYDEPYIYCAPFQANLEGQFEKRGDEDVLALEEHWGTKGPHWVVGVANSDEGVTQVSRVPHYDISTKFNNTHELFIYFGLHDNINAHKRLCLLFYDAGSGEFYNLDGADFTTPKPPFGTSKADYGLIKAIPED